VANPGPFADDPPEGQAPTQVALPGQDGNRAEELLAEAKRAGAATLADVMRSAVDRLLAQGANKPQVSRKLARLFSDAEKDKLAHALGATLATANLLGRSRIRERQRLAEAGVKFSDVQAFADFADPIPLLSPQAAVNYFRNLVPELGTDPKRFGRDMRRQAFTLAAATEETLVGKVQGEIATFLATGQGSYQRGFLTLPGGREIALTHEGPRAQAGGEVMVVVDVAKLDEAWQQNERGLYIPEGGGGPESEGGYQGRRREVQQFLRDNNTLQASAVQMIGNGVQFADGRHRFSVLRDMGVEALPVSVPAEDAERVQAVVGYEGRPPGAGVETLTGPQAVGRLLDQAGVSPQNPGYSELVFRTNAMDAYNTGSEEERQDPDVIETFPVWRMSNPDDGRSRPSHAARNGNYYAAEVSFFTVRGTAAEDVIQCRCVPIPVSKYEWKDLRAAGARLTRA
jgi:hypothetical protein